MSDQDPEEVRLTRAEREMVRVLAEREGISEDEAASRLVKQAIERRVKKKTGRGLSRIYTLPRKERS